MTDASRRRSALTALAVAVIASLIDRGISWLADFLRELQIPVVDLGAIARVLGDVSNGDILSVIQLFLIFYVYVSVREIQKAIPAMAARNRDRNILSRILGV